MSQDVRADGTHEVPAWESLARAALEPKRKLALTGEAS